ncbi:LOW QUALITY PROTEIN: ubiquitin carboxyl-terminal hydrolase 10 [Megalops cyprinoides]|uniref:LOW QUALITY PROTEIN: ubiquitin carboxyl-terminal hydrolase 10 n=1 Tax=Megalops cyprinoides TaxID=118141 RepID=UPI00186465F1|nr:LOW QUALITY PROTEIN: ubiquitin carboxyl-terminal hydrolase 10 [Megalops cyprinoides]
MASHSNQYIFGEFSPDEFDQFFMTPRCYVELPPLNGKFPCISHSSGRHYQHMEFSVEGLITPDSGEMKESMHKVSSTLNPQAPEFILGRQPSPKALQSFHCTDFSSVDCPDSELPSLESSCVDQGQRERKKKKKRPPGYYSYLKEASRNGCSPVAHAEVPLEVGLVNGHAFSVSGLWLEDMAGEVVSKAQHYNCSPDRSAPAQRICESPDESPLDFSSSSHSSRVAEEGRTAKQLPGPLPPGSPGLQGSGRRSPSPTCPPPPSTTAVTSTAHSDATTDEEESRDSGMSSGLVELDAVCSHGEQKDSSVKEKQPSVAPELLPLAEEVWSPLSLAAGVTSSPRSWASLFHNSKPQLGSPQAYVEVKNLPEAVTVAPAAVQTLQKVAEAKERIIHVSEDPMALKLAELIENVKLIHKAVSLKPRGLINKGNRSYMNATLQALVACPPMYHLMKSISMIKGKQRPYTSTPVIDNFVRLVNEFTSMPMPSKSKQQGAGYKVVAGIRPGLPFEPHYIYRLLSVFKPGLSEMGRQQDAEEYLGCILNGLHEEMLALKKLLYPQEEKVSTLNGPGSQPGAKEDMAEKEEEGSDDEWEQVRPRNKAAITRQADRVRTPITDIFGGHIRLIVYQQNSKESATLQPFFTLQLDIQSEKTHTVQEALEALVAQESAHGYPTKKQEIRRRVTLEVLPPVLVLHLKRFVFERAGGYQKLINNISYPIDLEISRDLISSRVRSKISKNQRMYRLFAVVYHHGNSVTGDHYSTDVFHIGLNSWLHIDNHTMKVISQHQVVKQTIERTAYLLYYRRVDLM